MPEERLTKKEQIAQKREQKAAKKQAAEKKAQMQKVAFGVILVLIVIGIVAIAKLAQPSVDEVIDLHPDPTKGTVGAEVVIKEYADLQCPACAGVHPVVEDLLEEYGDYVEFVYNDFPLPQHTLADDGAIAGECIFRQDNDKFFEYINMAYTTQNGWNTLSATEAQDRFRSYAEELEVDMEEFDACTSSNDAADVVQADIDEARALNVNATPTFFVNGKRVVEAPYSVSLRNAIEEALEEAGVEVEQPAEEENEESSSRIVPAEVTEQEGEEETDQEVESAE